MIDWNANCETARQSWFAGRQDEALSAWRAGAQAGHARSMYHLGICAYDSGDLAGARTWLERASEGGDVEAMSGLGTIANQVGDIPAARNWWTQAANRGWGQAAWNLHVIEGIDGRPVEASAALQRATALGYPPALYNEATQAEERGDSETAERLLRQAAEAGLPEAIFRLGCQRLEAGDDEGAYDIFLGLARNGHVLAASACASIDYREDRLDEAVDHLIRILALAEPDDANLANINGLLGSILLIQGDIDGGRRHLRTSQRLGSIEARTALDSLNASTPIDDFRGKSALTACAFAQMLAPRGPADQCGACGALANGGQKFCMQCGKPL